MITISTQSYKKPSFIQPAYSVNGATVQSDKTGELSHRFIFDIYVDNTKVGRLKSLPSYYNYSSVEISDIIKNYVENEFLHQTPRSIVNDEDYTTKDLYGVLRTQYGFLPKIKVLAGEEYKVGGVLTMFDGDDNTGDPAVEVSSYYTTYQAMDANSPQTLVGRGGITNSQFQANHLDVLQYVHQSNQNTYEWIWDGMNNRYRTDSTYASKIWKNYHIKELSNRPLEREINPELPTSVSYYEGQYMTLWNNQGEANPFDIKLSTLGRDYDMDPMNEDPLYTADWNIYRNRIQTIGFEFKDPAGLSVGEVRYQPVSPIFDQPIKDGFNFDIESLSQEDGVRVSEFLQTNVGAAAEYTKYEYNSTTDFINLIGDIDYGDLRGYTGDLSYFFEGNYGQLVGRSEVNYKEEDKICQYTPPSFLNESYNAPSYDWSSITDGPINHNGAQSLTPDEYVITIGNLINSIQMDWDFYQIPDRMEIIHMGSVIYDSGYVSGVGTHQFSVSGPASTSVYDIWEWMQNDGHKITIKIYRDNQGTLWDWSYQPGVDGLSGASMPVFQVNDMTLWSSCFKVLEPLKPEIDPITGNNYLSQTSTFSAFVNVSVFNNIGDLKNLVNDAPYSIINGEHFYILQTNLIDPSNNVGIIVGVDNNLGELYNDRYKFNSAPCLRVWNNDEGRWCNQDEVERLTGRSLESANYIGTNGRPAIEVLEATTLGQNEYGFDKEVSMTFRVNRGSSCPDVVVLPGIFNGLYYGGMTSNITYKMDRFRLVYGTDKPLRNANNYKLNVYDYDNHYNLIEEDYGNGGKFIYNYNNWVTPLLSTPGVWTPGDAIPYWTYGVNGNYFGNEGQTGSGYLNTYQEQRMMSGLINGISTTPGTYTMFGTNGGAFRQGQDTLAMSYLLKYGSSEFISQSTNITTKYEQKFGARIYVQASCMVLVEDTPEAVDLTYLSLSDIVTGPSLTFTQEIYRAQDKGRWKRIHTTIGIPASQFVEDPSTTLHSYVNLLVTTNLSTDANVWNGKYIDIADFKVNFLFDEATGLSERDNAANNVYTKNLKKLNWNREPHFTFSGDMLRNEAFSLYWLNPYGAWDDYRFKGRSLKTTQVSRESRGLGLDKTGTLNSNAVRVRQNFGDSISYKTTAYETYELTSDYLTDTEREWMEELFTSPKHYIYDEDKKWFIRVNLLNKEYSTIKKNNQKLYQIKIEVQVSSERRTQQVLGSL